MTPSKWFVAVAGFGVAVIAGVVCMAVFIVIVRF